MHRYNVNEEVIEELEREYDTTVAQLKELERSTQARRKREIQTLRRYVTDTGLILLKNKIYSMNVFIDFRCFVFLFKESATVYQK